MPAAPRRSHRLQERLELARVQDQPAGVVF